MNETFLRDENLIALDVGDARVGIALCASGSTNVSPLGAYLRSNGAAEREILRFIEDRNISLVVVGLPLSDDGSRNAQCDRTSRFCERLRKRSSARFTYFDEHSSSLEAKQRLQQSGVKEKLARKKGIIDAVAASVILEAYMSAQMKSAGSELSAESERSSLSASSASIVVRPER